MKDRMCIFKVCISCFLRMFRMITKRTYVQKLVAL